MIERGTLMADNEKNKGLLGMLGGAADSVLKTVQETVQGIKVPEISIPNPFQKPPEKGEAASPSRDIVSVSVKSAVMTFYYMMAADGTICQSEEEKFDEIGKELDPDFESHKAEIIRECRATLDKLLDPDDAFDVLRDGVEEAIAAGANAEGAVIAPKILVWDLLSIAWSDGDYAEAERRLLKYAVRKLNIDKAVFQEMESSYLTLLDLENELAWIKTTDRPYLTIEQTVNEIADRKTAIRESVKELLTL